MLSLRSIWAYITCRSLPAQPSFFSPERHDGFWLPGKAIGSLIRAIVILQLIRRDAPGRCLKIGQIPQRDGAKAWRLQSFPIHLFREHL